MGKTARNYLGYDSLDTPKHYAKLMVVDLKKMPSGVKGNRKAIKDMQ